MILYRRAKMYTMMDILCEVLLNQEKERCQMLLHLYGEAYHPSNSTQDQTQPDPSNDGTSTAVNTPCSFLSLVGY